MKIGYVAIHRKMQDSSLWLDEQFTRGQAWVDLIMLANHKDGYLRIRGNRIELKRGQCGWSVSRLSERWKWSRGKTSRFIKELELDSQISIKTDSRTSIITICNYELYQGCSTADDTTDDTTDGQQTGSRQYTNKNDNNVNNDNKKERGKGKCAPEWSPPSENLYLYDSGLKPYKLNPKKTAAMLTADWELCQEWGNWALNEGLEIDKVVREAAAFKDYFTSPNCKAANRYKVDWFTTWKNWVRKGL